MALTDEEALLFGQPSAKEDNASAPISDEATSPAVTAESPSRRYPVPLSDTLRQSLRALAKANHQPMWFTIVKLLETGVVARHGKGPM